MPCQLWGGRKEKNHWKRNAGSPGLLKIPKVMLMEKLHANLLSIGHICESDDSNVVINKNSCSVWSKERKCVMTGDGSSNNCYMVNTYSTAKDVSFCYLSKKNEMSIWHQRLGNLHLKGLE